MGKRRQGEDIKGRSGICPDREISRNVATEKDRKNKRKQRRKQFEMVVLRIGTRPDLSHTPRPGPFRQCAVSARDVRAMKQISPSRSSAVFARRQSRATPATAADLLTGFLRDNRPTRCRSVRWYQPASTIVPTVQREREFDDWAQLAGWQRVKVGRIKPNYVARWNATATIQMKDCGWVYQDGNRE